MSAADESISKVLLAQAHQAVVASHAGVEVITDELIVGAFELVEEIVGSDAASELSDYLPATVIRWLGIRCVCPPATPGCVAKVAVPTPCQGLRLGSCRNCPTADSSRVEEDGLDREPSHAELQERTVAAAPGALDDRSLGADGSDLASGARAGGIRASQL